MEMNKTIEEVSQGLEIEMESMELRILESIWSLERAVLDQIDLLKTHSRDLRDLKQNIEALPTQILSRKT